MSDARKINVYVVSTSGYEQRFFQVRQAIFFKKPKRLSLLAAAFPLYIAYGIKRKTKLPNIFQNPLSFFASVRGEWQCEPPLFRKAKKSSDFCRWQNSDEE